VGRRRRRRRREEEEEEEEEEGYRSHSVSCSRPGSQLHLRTKQRSGL
jgi:hypothetical protein